MFRLYHDINLKQVNFMIILFPDVSTEIKIDCKNSACSPSLVHLV